MNGTAHDIAPAGFEKLYTALRQKEGRMYSDEELASLPQVGKHHPHYKEWLIRRHSCEALLDYIRKKDRVLNILEVGCGNGWLCAQLARLPNTDVTGIDVNKKELDQARRVFKDIPSLHFVLGRPGTVEPALNKYDMIIFAASIQYFTSLKQVISSAIENLALLGEVHIIDTAFYRPGEIHAAKQRSAAYFKSMGFAQMTEYYHHHTLADLDNLQYKILHDPNSWKNKLLMNKNPFYWITIKTRYS